MTPDEFEALEIDALETGLQLRAIVEALETAGVDPEAITAALLASAIMLRRRHHGSDQVAPWLARSAERERCGVLRPHNARH